MDGSGSQNYAIYLKQLINRATDKKGFDENKIDEKLRHLVNAAGEVLHPFLRMDKKGKVKNKIVEWFWQDGIRKALRGKRIQDMTPLDLIDFQFSAYFNHITGRGQRGKHKGLMINTLFPDADRNLRMMFEADMRRTNDEFGVNFGTIMVNQTKDDDGNIKNRFALPYYDILEHLKDEVRMRENYQRQSTIRLADALTLAVFKGDIVNSEYVQIIEGMENLSPFDQRKALKRLWITSKNDPIHSSAIRFSEAWSHRDYITDKAGFIMRSGYETLLQDPGGQERVMTHKNIKKINELVKKNENGALEDKELTDAIEAIFKPLYKDTVKRFYDANFTLLPAMNIGEGHLKISNLHPAMKGFIINHYIMTNYMHSMINGTPFVFKDMEDANKRSRTATSDHSKPGTADERVLTAIASARSITVEDQIVYSVLPNFNSDDNELPHLAEIQAQDGLSEENPIMRYLWYMAYSEEMGPYPRYGSAKTIHHSTIDITKHSSSSITENSFRYSADHQKLVANMLDPLGKRFLTTPDENGKLVEDNLYSILMNRLREMSWDKAVEATAEIYMDNSGEYAMIGQLHRTSAKKQAPTRKVISHNEAVHGKDDIEADNFVFPTNAQEAQKMEQFGIHHFTEPIDPMNGGVSNTISKDVDESKITLSAQSLPVFMANDADVMSVKQLKELLSAMAENGFIELLGEISTKEHKFDLPSFIHHIVNRHSSDTERQEYADNLMNAIAKQGLENTGDRGHLQRLMNITQIGMDIAAKALKTDQAFGSIVRRKAVKMKIAAQRSLDNVLYGGDIIDYQDQVWVKADLITHLRRTNPSAIPSIEQMEGRDLVPMHFAIDEDKFLEWIEENPKSLMRVDKSQLDIKIKDALDFRAENDIENAPVPYNIDKHPVIVEDGDNQGIAVADSKGNIHVLMSGDALDFTFEGEDERVMTKEQKKVYKEKIEAFQHRLKALNKFVLDNKVGKINPAEIIAPSSYAEMVGATGIPINTLFGRYMNGVKNEQYLEALPEYRKALREAKINAFLAEEAGDKEALKKHEDEIAKITEEITQVVANRDDAETDDGYSYDSLLGMSETNTVRAIQEIIETQFPLMENGMVYIDENNPNTYILKMVKKAVFSRKVIDGMVGYKEAIEKARKIERAKYKNDTPSQLERRMEDIENKLYKRLLVKNLATELMKNLKKLEGELDGYMMRTPSTGAHSGSLTRVIAFSSKEQNTVRQSPLNMHASGKDLDGDAVSIYHREFFHDSFDDVAQQAAIAMNARLVQYVMDFYANTDNAPTIFDPINTRIAVELAKGERYSTGNKRAKKPNNPSNYVRGSVGSDYHLINQSFTGKHTISNSALQLKTMSYLISAIKEDPTGLYRYADINQNQNTKPAKLTKFAVKNIEMVHQLSNAISTITNLGTDNSKEQALGVWGMSQQNIGVVLQLINNPDELVERVNELMKWYGKRPINKKLSAQERTWVALNFLFRNEIVQTWINNQNYKSSLRYTNIENTGAYATLVDTINTLKGGALKKALTKKKQDLETDLPVMRQDLAKYLDETGTKPEKGTDARQEHDYLLNDIESDEKDLKSINKKLDDKAIDLLFWLSKKAFQAEQMEGFLSIANLNQKLPSTEWDLYNWKENIEKIFGLPIDTFFEVVRNPEIAKGLDDNMGLSEDGVAWDSPEAMALRTKYAFDTKREFALKSAREAKGSVHDYLIESISNSDKSEVLNYKNDFFKLDLLPVLLASPELMAYVKLVERKYRLLQADRMVETPIMQSWKSALLKRIGKDRLTENTHRWLQNKNREFLIGDYISYLARTDPYISNFSITTPDKSGKIRLTKNNGKTQHFYDVKVNLDSTYGTELFMQFFPTWFEYRANELLTDSIFENNAILNLFQSVGSANINFLTLIQDMNIPENKKMGDFKALPDDVQRLLSVYAVVKDGFNYKAGSLIESMSNWIYKDFGSYIKEKYLLKEDLNKLELEKKLKGYEEYILGQTNKYFMKGKSGQGASKIEEIGLEYGRNDLGESYIKAGQAIKVHTHKGKFWYSAHRDLFNSWRHGSDTVVEILARGKRKKKLLKCEKMTKNILAQSLSINWLL